MNKKSMLVLAVLMVGSILLSACGPTDGAGDEIKVCQITDTGGIDDKSFNQTAWKGVRTQKKPWASKVITWNHRKLPITRST